MKKLSIPFLLLSMLASENSCAQQAALIRGPYLQVLTPTSITIRWRTGQAEGSQVLLGTKADKMTRKIVDAKPVIDHEVIIGGLKPNTRYFYNVGSPTKMAPKDAEQFFTTAPVPGSTQPIRIWALGDFGNSSQNQFDCRDAILKATADHRPDVWLWLGDNTYNTGLEEEYQKHVFEVYQKDLLKNMPFFATPGNHDYGGHFESTTIPYFNIFSMPQKGEAGGVASGSKSYYSFDFGNVHFVSLDSEGLLDGGQILSDTTGKQVTWLKKDLAANKMPWTIVFWHHPPYSKGSHDSDTEEKMVKIREKLLPVLEQFKVDMVLGGHSHVYERTHPILGHTGLSESFDPAKHVVEQKVAPDQYQVKGRQGVIYIVNGSGGQIGGQEPGYPLKAAAYSNNTHGGSLILDVVGNKLEARWICADGVVRDHFSIVK